MIEIDMTSGLVIGVKHVASPNFDQRPDNTDVDLLVIHNISLPPGKFGGDEIEKFFTNQLDISADPYFAEIADLKVSSHILIKRDGNLVQFVPFHLRAWHAGESKFADKENCNNYSIGIELEGGDDCDYEMAQYESLIDLTQAIRKAYPSITKQRIVGHSDIAPGRKTDPGPNFDWQRYKRALT